MPESTIYLIGGEDDEAGEISYGSQEGLCRVSFHFRGRSVEALARDYFEAFSQIRLQLEPEGLIPFCYGASLNVFPSGMCRDMGAGLSAYRLVKGEVPSLGDLVKIFEAGPDVIPASVAEQRTFYSEWRRSRGL